MIDKEKELLTVLSSIRDPDLQKDIVSLGFIHNINIEQNTKVSLECVMPSPLHQDQFRLLIEDAAMQLEWLEEITVHTRFKPKKFPLEGKGGLAKVSTIIGISSCKGGVGKSTVAANLAFTLAQTGARVGLFDADIYGPSIPTMVQAQQSTLNSNGDRILPINFRGVKLMSFGYVQNSNGESGPAVMRGPMVTQVVNQLLTGTEWGELDYLLIDMPPGTGDIQITLGQLIPMTAAVIVTTPQQLSFIDVEKGIQMFDKLKVPTVCVVENMSYFLCDSCDIKHRLFGEGALQKLLTQFGIASSVEIPIEKKISFCGDNGLPYVIQEKTSETANAFRTLMRSVLGEITRLAYGINKAPQFTVKDKYLMMNLEDTVYQLDSFVLRMQCRCASCIDEFSGVKKVKESDIPNDIHVLGVKAVGNYALGIQWSDTHFSLMPYTQIVEAIQVKKTV